MKKKQKHFYIAGSLLAAFVLWTMAVCIIDVQPIGPMNSTVGFAALNQFIHERTGVHMTLYILTDWLGLVPLALGIGFALLGLKQWIQRKKLRKVDFNILILGGFYLVVMAAYLFFEEFIVNYRPVLIDGFLEASYPSSTTLLAMCMMPTAMMQLNRRIKSKWFRKGTQLVVTAFTAFMVIGRFISGVHWFTDIVGSILLSTGLVTLYYAVCKLETE